ncbi:MAG: DUF192 domain-containing protein [Deltaproteobacteria bacterium]|jgi:uncharacterized protein|nr:DUF192 domain-containing protein [Deltaproteobacteria bacterium]
MMPKTSQRIILLLILLPSFLLGFGERAYPQGEGKTSVQLTIKGKKIRVEVARTEEEKSQGLMFRDKLGPNEGMLFIYEREDFLSFWMKNTPLPLSIAFLDQRGKIVDIQDMEPFNLRTHTSARPALYALEMNKGWFKKNGVKVGEKVQMPPSLIK